MNEGHRTRILVVDDSPICMDIISEALAPLAEVRGALDGQSGLEQALADPPDLIVLDIMMPGVDGNDLMMQFKSDPTTAAIPIVFVTALSGEQAEAMGRALGADDYITKPIEVSDLQQRVTNALQRGRR